MTKEHSFGGSAENDRPLWPAVMNGARARCPSCGVSKLFTHGTKVMDQCHVCKEEFHHHRADDLPAYLNVLVIGHIVVGLMMTVYIMKLLDIWTLMALTISVAIVASILLMRPIKGAVVAAQWAMRMHGFGGHRD